MGKRKQKPRTYVLGDLHGAYDALIQVLRRSHFDYEKDCLIFLGDLADGWGDFDKCLLEFSKIKNFIPILGNHDLYLRRFLFKNILDDRWLKIGGAQTLRIIEDNPDLVPLLKDYFDKCKYYYVVGNQFFCHGGFNHKRLIKKQKKKTFCINRKLNKLAKQYDRQNLKVKVDYDEKKSIKIDEIFIGHSTTKDLKPSFYSNVVNIDTGIGSVGCLTLMDIRTKNYVQSDPVSKLFKTLF